MKVPFICLVILLMPIRAHAGTVTLTWDADDWPDTTYLVAYWPHHTSQVRYVTVTRPSVTLVLPDDQTYCARVIAIDTFGQSSEPSGTVFLQTSSTEEAE